MSFVFTRLTFIRNSNAGTLHNDQYKQVQGKGNPRHS